MYLNLKNTKFKNRFFLILFLFFCFLFINFYKKNLVFAGKFFSKNKKIDSSKSKKIEVQTLRFQIDDLSRQKDLILEEIDKLEKDLLFYSEEKNNENMNFSKSDLTNLKFKITFLRKKNFLLKTQFHELALEKRHLEMELRKILNFVEK